MWRINVSERHEKYLASQPKGLALGDNLVVIFYLHFILSSLSVILALVEIRGKVFIFDENISRFLTWVTFNVIAGELSRRQRRTWDMVIRIQVSSAFSSQPLIN